MSDKTDIRRRKPSPSSEKGNLLYLREALLTMLHNPTYQSAGATREENACLQGGVRPEILVNTTSTGIVHLKAALCRDSHNPFQLRFRLRLYKDHMLRL